MDCKRVRELLEDVKQYGDTRALKELITASYLDLNDCYELEATIDQIKSTYDELREAAIELEADIKNFLDGYFEFSDNLSIVESSLNEKDLLLQYYTKTRGYPDIDPEIMDALLQLVDRLRYIRDDIERLKKAYEVYSNTNEEFTRYFLERSRKFTRYDVMNAIEMFRDAVRNLTIREPSSWDYLRRAWGHVREIVESLGVNERPYDYLRYLDPSDPLNDLQSIYTSNSYYCRVLEERFDDFHAFSEKVQRGEVTPEEVEDFIHRYGDFRCEFMGCSYRLEDELHQLS